MTELLMLTVQNEPGLSAPNIAHKLSQVMERAVSDSYVTGLWQEFGGREKFVEKASQDIREGRTLARQPAEPKADPMSEAELRTFAQLYRVKPFRVAFAALRPNGPKMSKSCVEAFLKRKCGSLTDFFIQYG
ncbi:MAG: hypothetical protein AAB605_04170 [Patescibacteria group bacterium]